MHRLQLVTDISCARFVIVLVDLDNCPYHCGHLAPDAHDHFHTCTKTRGATVTHRHRAVLDVLCDLAKSIGMFVSVEPRNDVDRDTRADAIIAGSSGRWMIDVSITDPTAPSYKGGAPGRAPYRESSKRKEYGDTAAAAHCELVPLVLESYGTWGDDAKNFITAMGEESDPAGDNDRIDAWTARARTAISCALQRGNGMIGVEGVRRARNDPEQCPPLFPPAPIITRSGRMSRTAIAVRQHS